MIHWRASSALGLLLTGRHRPVCAAVYAAPDCAARRAFCRAVGWWFGEPDHARRIALTYVIGRALR